MSGVEQASLAQAALSPRLRWAGAPMTIWALRYNHLDRQLRGLAGSTENSPTSHLGRLDHLTQC